MAADQTKRVPGTLIVAGIGDADSFEALLSDLGGIPERLILVEPAETPGGTYAQRFAGITGGDLVDGVLAEAAGSTDLVRYNLPGLRSLRAPTKALYTLFPGLQERARIATQTVQAAQVLGDPGALPSPVRLRVDLPGAEPEILSALEDAGALEPIELLSLRCCVDVPFEGGWNRAQLQSWLEARHIRLDHADEDDPDWPELRLTADPAARRIAALEAELAEAEAAHKKLETERDQATAQAESLRKKIEEVREEAMAETEKLRAELSRSAEQLKARDTDLAETSDKLKAETAKRAEAEQNLQETRTALEEAQKQAEMRKAELAETEAARKNLEADLEGARREAEKRMTHLDEMETAAAQAYKDRDKAYSDLGVAMRMQGLLQSDLDDLRERYRESEETRTSQEELLRKLTPQLQNAAGQLRQLQLEASPEEASGVLSATEATTKPKSRSGTTRKRTTKRKNANGK